MANLHRIIYVKKRQGNKFNSNEAKQEKALNQVLCVGSSYDTKELESVLYSGKLESQTPEKFFALQDELEEMQQKLGDSLFKELKLRQEKLGAAVESSMKQDKKEILPLLLKMITDKSLGTL